LYGIVLIPQHIVAELLVVVAIIGILVAVSIPIFTAQLTKARIATNDANARAAKAAATAAYFTDDSVAGGSYTVADGKFISATTAPAAAKSVDYGSSATGTISTFTVTITTANNATTVDVTPKDTGASGGTYNK
jgi:type II secretory pathway pseudopilin PulG